MDQVQRLEPESLVGLGANQRHRLPQSPHAHRAEEEVAQTEIRMRLRVPGIEGYRPLEPDLGWRLRFHGVAEDELSSFE